MKQKIFTFSVPLIYLILQNITRVLLSAYAISKAQINESDLAVIFITGLLNDLISVCYFLPLAYFSSALITGLLTKLPRIKIILFFVIYFVITALLLFNMLAEIIFWDEFGTRFNFIAVDYLVYTNEIIGTLKESLPFNKIVTGIFITSLVTIFVLRKKIVINALNFSAGRQIKVAVYIFVISLITYNFYNEKKLEFNSNRYANELAKNGLYQLFSAFFDNSLDYEKFYPTIDDKLALRIIRKQLQEPNQKFLNDESIDRTVEKNLNQSEALKHNVIIITVESLSAEFMGKFGNKANITPYLDKMAQKSIFFTNMYAAGTRTVRGLEAITLSIPPIPGSSIIRRPQNQQLFNISSELRNQGYDVNFIFGGYSYFDNLKNYFTNNNFNIVDRSDLKSQEISFSNIWGVADEDILHKSIEVANKSYNSGVPFFSLIMTTSNHRPYTFPEGRIDIPSGDGRNAAVKYTDYAIGKFMDEASRQPWFDNTIFIITADHCAASAGKTDLPINKYHIPLMIYAPKLLKPRIIENLASQIDIAPTLLGILNFNYTTKFFGHDILQTQPNRAFIGTYQLLGYLKDNHLVILAPKINPVVYKLIDDKKVEVYDKQELINEAISFYMLANKQYMQDKMKDFKFKEK